MEKIKKEEVLVGKKLVEARVEKGLSRSSVASMLGISHQQMQKYEAGINRISAGKLYYLAKKLGLPITYFYKKESGVAAKKSLSKKEQSEITGLIRKYSKISPKAKKIVSSLLDELARDGKAKK